MSYGIYRHYPRVATRPRKKIIFSAATAATGAMSGSSTISVSATAKLVGDVVFSGDSSIVTTVEAILGGSGSITGSTENSIGATGVLVANGSFSGNSFIVATINAILKADGRVEGETEINIDATGAILGIGGGSISGISQISISATGELEGVGGISGDSEISIDPSAKLDGAGAISGNSSIIETVEATIRGMGLILGESTISIDATGTLTGVTSGSMSGTSTITISAIAKIVGDGLISGETSLLITATGILSSGTVSIHFGIGLFIMKKTAIFNGEFPQTILPVIEINSSTTAQGEILINNSDIVSVNSLTAEVVGVTPPSSENNYWDSDPADLFSSDILYLNSTFKRGLVILKWRFSGPAVRLVSDSEYFGILIRLNESTSASIPDVGYEQIIKVFNNIQ